MRLEPKLKSSGLAHSSGDDRASSCPSGLCMEHHGIGMLTTRTDWMHPVRDSFLQILIHHPPMNNVHVVSPGS